MVQEGLSAGWGQVLSLPENKRREELGFSSSAGFSKTGVNSKPVGNTFYSVGFIPAPSEANAIIEDNPEGVTRNFVTRWISHNWVAVDVPSVTHLSK